MNLEWDDKESKIYDKYHNPRCGSDITQGDISETEDNQQKVIMKNFIECKSGREES